MCFVLQRENAIDAVRAVYRNITVEKIHLLQAMSRLEVERKKQSDELNSMLSTFEESLKVCRVFFVGAKGSGVLIISFYPEHSRYVRSTSGFANLV